MINLNRIVPVTATDLITLYGTIMKLAGTTVASVEASNPGVFVVSSGSGNLLAAEPVKSFDFATGITSAKLYFVAAYDFEGFKVAGAAVTPSGAEVKADGCTLYTATLASGAVTITKAGM